MPMKLSRPALVVSIALGAVLVLGLAAILIGSLHRPADDRTVSGPVDGVRDATFELVDGVTSVQVRAASLGDDLYRASADDPLRIDRDGGNVALHAPGGTVDVQLNSSVAWRLRMAGGVRELRIDMSAATTESVEVAGGAGLIDVTLARPSRPVTVAMSGGADQFRVRLPSGTPVRVIAASGAGSVTIAGQPHQGVAGGESFSTNGWQDGAPGVDVQARAGAGVVIVDA